MSDDAAEVAERNSQVDLFLVKKDKINALVAALANPPVNTKEDSIKVSPYLSSFCTLCVYLC